MTAAKLSLSGEKYVLAVQVDGEIFLHKQWGEETQIRPMPIWTSGEKFSFRSQFLCKQDVGVVERRSSPFCFLQNISSVKQVAVSHSAGQNSRRLDK